MKDFNIMRFTEKFDFYGGSLRKKQYIGENCLKRGSWAVCRFKRGGGGVWRKKHDAHQVTIHMFPNISRSKGNQTMKFGQLVEYNVKNIFLCKLCRK